jgi:hypothetical protein
MFTPPRHWRRVFTLFILVLVLLVGVVAWSSGHHDGASSAAETTTSNGANSSKPLSTPTATVTQDAQFLADVTEVDPALSTYEHQSGNVALRSLLTDGSAFCAFLQRDDSIDEALVSVGVGARSDESTTHLPLSVTTFNSIDSVALLTLCPSLQTVVPASVMAKIRTLNDSLTSRQK